MKNRWASEHFRLGGYPVEDSGPQPYLYRNWDRFEETHL